MGRWESPGASEAVLERLVSGPESHDFNTFGVSVHIL